MNIINNNKYCISLLLLTRLFAAHPSSAQQTSPAVNQAIGDSTESLFPLAHFDEKAIFSLNQARTVQQFDAMPDASHWFVVDEFNHWQYITIDGKEFPDRYHEIAATGTRLSPNGDYLIWTGLMRALTYNGFDSTMTYVHKNKSLIGKWVSDYPALEFSHSGKRWAEMLPHANYHLEGHVDLVLVDGKVVREREPFPHEFSFSHDEKHWAYRATQGLNEDLITDRSDTAIFLYKGNVPSAAGTTYNSTIWRYTPDVSLNHKMLEGRDYEFDFDHVVRVNKTAFSSKASDTVHSFVNYNGKNQGLYRWTSQFLMDDSGHHLAYFAADPDLPLHGGDERRAVVVYDGSVFAGPFPGATSLFMSPSGRHIAFALTTDDPKLYLDKQVVANTSFVMSIVWSPDESSIAYVSSGQHGKYFVVANGKRSGLFEEIGRVGWTKDGKNIQFAGIRNGRLIHVIQSAE